jgi:hypothetical protein
MAERGMIACQGRRYIMLRGSGLDVAPQWLLPVASSPARDGANGEGYRANGPVSGRATPPSGPLARGLGGGRPERHAGAV